MDLDDLNFRNPIKMGYYDPFNVLPLVREEIESKWPITNLHWKFYTAKSVKSIPLLPVTFVEEIPKPNIEISKISDDRYIRMMFVKYDSIEGYRSQIRPLIKEWLKSLVSKSNVEWMIVLVVPSSSKYKQSSLIKTSVYDKLKNDFGIEGKELSKLLTDLNIRFDFTVDRCFRIHEQYDTDAEKIEISSEFMKLCKEALIRTFNNKQTLFQQQLDIVSREEQGNYRAFLVKLNYAKFLGDIRLLKEADEIYELMPALLSEVWALNTDIFVVSLTYPEDINSYRLEYEFDLGTVLHQVNSFSVTSTSKLSLVDIRCLIFVNQSAILQSLANFANTISISALYISNLYRQLLQFIDSLKTMVQSDPERNELELSQFLYAIIDCYLKLPICEKVIEVSNANRNEDLNGNGEVYQLNEIYEIKGELKLVQRSLLNDLGYLFSYKRTDHIMDSVELETTMQKYKPSELKFDQLASFMKNEDSYFEAFDKLTESAIQDFVIAGRSKTVDILSIDLVIMHYKRGNYRLAFDVLQDSYEFFIEQRWNFMGGVLLEIYIDCKHKLEEFSESELVSPYMKLLSLLSTSQMSQGNINCYRITKTTAQVKEILLKAIQISENLETRETFPLSWAFEFEIKPFIHPDSSTLNKYYLNLDLKNLLGININVNLISVILRSTDNDTAITFTSGPLTITPQSTVVPLYSTFFKMATFVVESVTIELTPNIGFVEKVSRETSSNGKANTTVVRFSKSILAEDFHDSMIIHDDRGNAKDMRIHYYQCLRKLWCEFTVPTLILLGSSEIVLTLHNEYNLMRNINIQLLELTAGLKFNRDSVESELKKEELQPNELFSIVIPYTFFSDSKLISVGCEITYEIDDVKYTHIMRQEVDTTLTVSVSVQDIFKPTCLFLNFQICTANAKFPVKLISCSAKCDNESYTIEEPKVKPSNIITFGEQPVSVFYRILLKENARIQLEDKIDLTVEYSGIKDESSQVILLQVKELLLKEGLLDYWFVLVDVIAKQFRFDLNHFAINKKIKVLNAMEMLILLDKVVGRYVEKEEDRSRILSIMKTALSDSNCISDDVQFNYQRLTIPVSIPTLRFLHRARYEFTRTPFYLVGEPIRVNLTVESILKWSSGLLELDSQGELSVLAESSPGKDMANGKADGTEESLEFTISIPNDENWLVSGYKKKTFSTTTASNIEIVLVPLTVGKLHLPRVLIRSLDTSQNNGNTLTSNLNNNAEVDVANGAETLLVLAEQEGISFAF